MEEALILSKFEGLVQSGLVLYDDKQETIEQIDGELKVSVAWTQTHSLLTHACVDDLCRSFTSSSPLLLLRSRLSMRSYHGQKTMLSCIS